MTGPPFQAERAIFGALTLSGKTVIFETTVCIFSETNWYFGPPAMLGFRKTKTEYYGGAQKPLSVPPPEYSV